MNLLSISLRSKYLLIAGFCLIAIGFALYSQHVWDMRPCPYCILQRMVMIVVGVLALTFSLIQPKFERLARFLIPSGFLVGACLAIFQHLVAAKTDSCGASHAHGFIIWTGLDSLVPALFEVTASCAESADFKLLGLPYEVVTGVLFVALAVGSYGLLKQEGSRYASHHDH